MARNYSVDFRLRILDACQQGQRPREVARRLKVSERCVYYLLSHVRQTGSVKPRVGKTGPKPKLAAHHEHLLELLRKHPDLTLEALREKLGVDVCLATHWKSLKKLGLTLKKALHAAEQHRPDVAQRREEWSSKQAQWDATQLVFIDETWAKTNMTRAQGWAPKG